LQIHLFFTQRGCPMQTLKDLNPLRRLNTPGPLHSPEKQFKLTPSIADDMPQPKLSR
jgi:hypothetical protein